MWMKRVVIGLAVIYVLTFLGGFLQATRFNYLNYVLFSLLFLGGLLLMVLTVKSSAVGWTRGALSLTGISTTLLFILFVAYESSRLSGDGELETSLEGLLYLTTLFFWILVVTSLVSLRRSRAGTVESA